MKRLLSVFICLVLAYALLLMLPAYNRLQNIAFYLPDSFNVIAHANGRALLPGNTLEAAINASDVGADILELDVHLTLDGHLVVRHDENIDTTTNGAGLIAEMTLAEIQQYSVGFHEIDYPHLVAPSGIKIPTLKSLFDQLSDSRFLIEIKPQDIRVADRLCQLVKEHKLDKQVLVGSYHESVLQYFRQTCPTVPTSLAASEIDRMVLLSKLGLGHLYKSSGYSLQVPISYNGIEVLTPALIRMAHQLNMRIDVWTVNDPALMKRLMDMGVNGIITDRPDMLNSLVES